MLQLMRYDIKDQIQGWSMKMTGVVIYTLSGVLYRKLQGNTIPNTDHEAT